VGTQTENAESADWYNADYIIAWGSNINVTRIPDAKYFLEAGYDGAKRVGIFTDYSQTAIHCDEWIGPEPGSDTALALGMARTIVDEGLYDEEHLKEQTDMPLLVREDTGKFLRASEVSGLSVDADRPEKVFVMQDADGTLRTAPGSLGERDGQHDHSVSIELDFDPELAVKRTVGTTDGDIETRSVWLNLRDELSEYTPSASTRSRASAGRLTRRSPASSPKSTARRSSTGRGQRLVPQRSGEPFDPTARHAHGEPRPTGNGSRPLRRPGEDLDVQRVEEPLVPDRKRPGRPDDALDVLPRRDHGEHRPGHGGEDSGVDRQGVDAAVPERTRRQRPPGPRVMFVWRGNYFNQAKGNIAVEEELWPKLDLVVDINFRMDSTALNSDIVLPTASHYEKHDLSETDMHTYVHPFTPAVEPLGESKTDWQIFRDLAAKIQELAADRGTEPVDDRKFDRQIDLQSVHDDYVRDWLDDEPGALSEDKAAAEFILENSEETNPEGTDEQITFDEIDEQPKRLLETGDHWSSDIEEGEAYTPWKDYVQDKNPWPTFTGRQQYYIDHDWFLELDEQLPTHKEAPVLQEKSEYPLGYNTPHSRWSIHSTWRDSSKMLRLQRGEPTVYLNPDDAEERGSRTATPCGCTTTSTRSRCRRRSTRAGSPAPSGTSSAGSGSSTPTATTSIRSSRCT